jgi:hypothetical protein
VGGEEEKREQAGHGERDGDTNVKPSGHGVSTQADRSVHHEPIGEVDAANQQCIGNWRIGSGLCEGLFRTNRRNESPNRNSLAYAGSGSADSSDRPDSTGYFFGRI